MTVTERALRAIAEPPTQEDYLAHLQRSVGPTRKLRIQDADGRGPWRPGFSHYWIDPNKDDSLCPPMMLEFPRWRAKLDHAASRGLVHVGCYVDGVRGLHRWFTPDELSRLARLGFNLHDASRLMPICVGASHSIGGSPFPVSTLPRIQWSELQ